MIITGVSSISGQQIIATAAISAKSAALSNTAIRDVEGNVITATYQKTADMTAYQTTADMTAYATSASVTGTAQYALTTAGWSEVTGGGVTGDYELSAGSGISIEDFPEQQKTVISVTGGAADIPAETSGLWQTASETVTANSGAWGGSALPVSAGPGVTFSVIDGKLVFKSDETILYDNMTGRPASVGSQIQLTESPLNFEYIEIFLNGSTPSGSSNLANGYNKVPNEYLSHINSLCFNCDFNANNNFTNTGVVWNMGAGYSGVSSMTWTKVYGYAHPITSFPSDWFTNNTHLNIYKIVGLNRKA